MGNNKIISLATPSANSDAATKSYVDGLVTGLDFQDSVLDKDLATPPVSPTTGDRYIVATGGTGAWTGHDNEIAEWNGSAWDFTVPNEGYNLWVEDENVSYVYNGTSWVKFGTTLDHTNLLNTGTNTHTQIDSHISSVSNPHSVTASQIGFGTISNTPSLDQSLQTTDSPTFANLDLTGALSSDTISEKTLNVGVTIDSVLLKDGLVDGVDVSALKTDVDGFPDELKNLATAEIQQLENIDTTTISVTQWGYVGSLDQALKTTDSPTFAGLTLTGSLLSQYIEQNSATADTTIYVRNTDATYQASLNVEKDIIVGGLVDGVDVSALKTDVDGFPNELKNLVTAEIQQLENIDTTTISVTQWGYVGSLDQALASTDSPSFDATTIGEYNAKYVSAYTDLGNVGKWFKIADVSITSQFSSSSTRIKILGSYGGGVTDIAHGEFYFRVKQQNAFGGDPHVQLELINARTFTNSDIVAVIIRNTPDTLVELYLKVTHSYAYYNIFPQVHEDVNNITFYSNQTFLTSLPAGTQISCSDLRTIGNLFDISITSPAVNDILVYDGVSDWKNTYKIDQNLRTSDSPTFAGLTLTADLNLPFVGATIFLNTDDLVLDTDGTNGYIKSAANLHFQPSNTETFYMNSAGFYPATANTIDFGGTANEWKTGYFGEGTSSGLYLGAGQQNNLWYDSGNDRLRIDNPRAFFRSLTTNFGATIRMVPNGTPSGMTATLGLFKTDFTADGVNFEILELLAANSTPYLGVVDAYGILSRKGGTGVLRDVIFGTYDTSLTEYLRIDTTNSLTKFSQDVNIIDNKNLYFGSGQDNYFHYDSTNDFLNLLGTSTSRLQFQSFDQVHFLISGIFNIRDIDDANAYLFRLNTSTRVLTIGDTADPIATTHYGDFLFPDNNNLYFGTDSDFKLYYYPTNNQLWIHDGTNDILRFNKGTTWYSRYTFSPLVDNAIDLGTTSLRIRDIYTYDTNYYGSPSLKGTYYRSDIGDGNIPQLLTSIMGHAINNDAWAGANVVSLEYWNGSAWVDYSASYDGQNLFTDDYDEQVIIDDTHTKIRVQITGLSWTALAGLVINRSYTAQIGNGFTVTVESSTDAFATNSTTRLSATFVNSGSEIVFIPMSHINVADNDWRITLEDTTLTAGQSQIFWRIKAVSSRATGTDGVNKANRLYLNYSNGYKFNLDRDLNITGNLDITGTVDGVDVSVHAGDSTIHFTQASITTLGTVTAGDVSAIDSIGNVAGKTSGDIFYWTTSLQRLAKGTDGQVLTLSGGVPVWATGGGGASQLNDLSDVTLTTPAANDVMVYDGTSQWKNTYKINQNLQTGDSVTFGGLTVNGNTVLQELFDFRDSATNDYAKIRLGFGIGTGSTDWRLWIAPRNTADTDFYWAKEFGFDQATGKWYVETDFDAKGGLTVTGNASVSGDLTVNNASIQSLGGYANLRLAGNGTNKWGFIQSENSMHLTQNAYYDGGWKSIAASPSKAVILQTRLSAGGAFAVRVDKSVTAANQALSFTDLFTVEAATGDTEVLDGTFRVTSGDSTSFTGAGTEIQYTGGQGEIFAYDRTALTYMPLRLRGSPIYLSPINGSLILNLASDTSYFDIRRYSATGRSQIRLNDESGVELWRFGTTSAGGTDFNFYDGTNNVLTLGSGRLSTPNADNTHYLGRAEIGYVGYASYAGFRYRGLGLLSYALLQSSSGSTYLNAKTGQNIYLRINNATTATISGSSVSFEKYLESKGNPTSAPSTSSVYYGLGSSGTFKIYTAYGYFEIGARNSSYAHIYSSNTSGLSLQIYFRDQLQVNNRILPYGSDPTSHDLGSSLQHWKGVYYQTLYAYSTRAIKSQIADIDTTTMFNIYDKLDSKQFVFNQDPEKKKQFGFIAEEVANVLPDAVAYVKNEKTQESTPNSVNYQNFIGLNFSMIKYLNNENKKLKNRIQILENELLVLKKNNKS